MYLAFCLHFRSATRKKKKERNVLVAPFLSFSPGSSCKPFVPPHQLPYTSAGSSSSTVAKKIRVRGDPTCSLSVLCSYLQSLFVQRDFFSLNLLHDALELCEGTTERAFRDRSSFCISLKVSPQLSTVLKRSRIIMRGESNFFLL